jgi:hypothetical protein
LWENVVGPKENHFAEPNQCVLTFLHSIFFLLGPHTVMSTCGAALPALPEEEDIKLSVKRDCWMQISVVEQFQHFTNF